MSDTLASRVRAAAGAGWVAVILFAVILTVSWLGALALMHARPEWVLKLLGGGMALNWDRLQTMYLWAFAALKMALWAMLIGVIWLSLWACRLKRLEEPKAA